MKQYPAVVDLRMVGDSQSDGATARKRGVKADIHSLLLYYAFLILSLIHIPLIPVVRGDFIGVFDFASVFLFALLILSRKRRLLNLKRNTPIMKLLFAYLLYTAFAIIKELLLSISGDGFKGIYYVALVLKQVQFMIFYVISFYFLVNYKFIIKYFHYILILFIAIIYINGMYQLFVLQNWYRLGIPFKHGVSSNLAGLILSQCILILVYKALKGEKRNIYSQLIYLTAIIFGAIALSYAKSRTNGIILYLFIAILVYIIKGEKKEFLVFSLACLSVSLFFLWGMVNEDRQPDGRSTMFLRRNFVASYSNYIANPSAAIEDGSFQGRLRAWKEALSDFEVNFVEIFSGQGLSKVTSIDNMFLRTFINHGLIGLAFFVSIYLVLFRSARGLLSRMSVLFVILNGIFMDTMVVSFRAVQVIIPVLCYAIMHDRDIKDSEKSLTVSR
ncbi:MAG: hypothetical protein GF398_21150 [Chitinivibrionales bacterium]|nr:hypothetical protein [Chitinivibrionales bacterium]